MHGRRNLGKVWTSPWVEKVDLEDMRVLYSWDRVSDSKEKPRNQRDTLNI
jgi:hypothetical protein